MIENSTLNVFIGQFHLKDVRKHLGKLTNLKSLHILKDKLIYFDNLIEMNMVEISFSSL